ncbi:hypothetical protein HAX54_052933 [Datura stramonium]|uniref:B box-type domain-containing protein n=1 Tax=Datura stramonium TaxID=4076 RepID=A0ABS8T0P3_DATST|nr:hypothetical protein [Datura stramonium]
MKIQCNACEIAEAKVLCCADEAALCWYCDDKVHAANNLANKHQRVPLSASSSPMPKCDICQVLVDICVFHSSLLEEVNNALIQQETVGYFFCLEDRALLCRKCDISIHTVNAYVSAHQRFLLTGVKVGLEPIGPFASASSGKSHSIQKVVEQESPPISKSVAPVSSVAQCDFHTGGTGDFAPSRPPLVGGSAAGIIPQWQFDEFLGMGDFNQNCGYMDYGPSKSCAMCMSTAAHTGLAGVWPADNAKLGESDSSPISRNADAVVEGDECYSTEVPDTCWAVPQIPSPPTDSGLHWPTKTIQNPFDAALLESDVSYFPLQNIQDEQSNVSGFKRTRHF